MGEFTMSSIAAIEKRVRSSRLSVTTSSGCFEMLYLDT
ncbi:hypothetical protein M7I_0214 [Glarea lozoyensis 74030]|uniref:Uncharacterized protein n=1 Tax=Glarea lozoyensis (strain ATCC 74030 / MF5533) TaxID=1104152 RepID=H0ECR9_GLAL7|nr:hypothetical protein M7I_0214 [Glarea lozoyensis 74030]